MALAPRTYPHLSGTYLSAAGDLNPALGRGREHHGEEAAGGASERRRHGGEPEPRGEAQEGEAATACHGGHLFLLVVQGQRQHSHHGAAAGERAGRLLLSLLAPSCAWFCLSLLINSPFHSPALLLLQLYCTLYDRYTLYIYHHVRRRATGPPPCKDRHLCFIFGRGSEL